MGTFRSPLPSKSDRCIFLEKAAIFTATQRTFLLLPSFCIISLVHDNVHKSLWHDRWAKSSLFVKGTFPGISFHRMATAGT